jgi:alpha-L-fucosidase
MSVPGAAFAQDPHAHETPAQKDKRMHWWREARFGMFIHWGLYAVPAGTWDGKRYPGLGEWLMHDAKIPVADYAALAGRFNPTRFDADRWVRLAKAAGMKYIVMTSKHHDGFAMYRTAASPFNIVDATPFKRDPIAEMAAACKRHGLRFGLYYSQAQDWHHAGGGAYDGHWDPAQNGDLHAYVQKIAVPQVREILTKYRPAVLWWDTPIQMTPEDVRALTAAFPTVPGLIHNNRLGNGVPGDTETPEQHIPATGFPNRDWETCMTMNDTWGFKTNDQNYKSTATLLRNLIDIASKGGNFLLNVGPDATGVIPAPQVERLEAIGGWLKKNGASVYATTASPYRRLPFQGRATVKGNRLYLNVFEWPAEGLSLSGLQTPVQATRSLATGEKLAFQKASDGTLRIARPAHLDPISTTVEIRLSGRPVVVEPEIVTAPQGDGTYALRAADAALEGTLQTEGSGETNIGYWTNATDAASWKIAVPEGKGGVYKVGLLYACAPDSAGSTFRIEVDGIASGITGTVAATGSWGDYRTVTLDGTLTLRPGRHVVRIRPQTKPGLGVMNLRRLILTPAGE